jgi:cell division protein FtsQ
MTGTLVDRPTEPSIDRRIRARRIEVRRGEARRRLHRLVAVLVASVIVLLGWFATRSPLLDVDHVEVLGAAQTPVSDVVQQSGITTGSPLVDVDVAASAAKIATLPWIADVSVERAWAGTVTVTITERAPVAVALASDGTAWLVDATGAVLAEAAADEGAVVIEGLDPPAPGGLLDPSSAVALGVAARLPESARPLVAAVEARSDGVWVRLVPRPGESEVDGTPRADGGLVRLGDGRDLDEQLRSIATVLDQVQLRDLAVLDVRVPSNPVVTRVVHAEVAAPDTGEVAG